MKSVTARAPINIALIKYWGKKDDVEVLPFQPSLSLSLDIFETRTHLSNNETQEFIFSINGKEDEKVKQKAITFLRLFDPNIKLDGITIQTKNTGPTAAGLASSASGFAALAVAANHFFGFHYSLDKLASITRKGSGSSIRSLLPSAVAWYPEGHIQPIHFPFDDVVLGVIIINDQEKSIGSTEAMKLSVETSPEYANWVHQSHLDFDAFLIGLKEENFDTIGSITEKNALYMHHICETTVPSIKYLSQHSKKVIALIQHLREQQHIQAYVTMDAGPNVKVLTRKKYQSLLEHYLSEEHIHILWSGIDTQGAVIVDE